MAILRCTCKHEYQDKIHGRGLRVHTMKADKKYVCTVCRTERTRDIGPIALDRI